MPNLSDLHLHWIDALIIVGYLSGLLAVGVYHSRRQKSLSEFFLAGQEMRWAVIGMSMLAALNSGIDYLMQPGAMIKFGVCVLVFNLAWLVVLPYVCLITVPLYRRLGAISAYEYLERRFDVRVRLLAAVIFMLWRMGWMATALYVPAKVISTSTGGRLSVAGITIAIGLLITVYTLLGGIRAVIWNDVVQYCIMFLGLAVSVGMAISAVDGGFWTVIAQLPKVGEPEQLVPPAGAPEGFMSYFYIPMSASGFFICILVARLGTYTSDQVMVQRVQTARTVSDARRGFYVTAISDVIWMLALCFVGLALYAYFVAKEGSLPAWAATDPDQVFPYFIAHVFPVGLTGLVIAAILAASISSIDSALNSMTSTTMIDFVERLYFGLRPAAINEPAEDERNKRKVLLSRLITLALGLIGIVLSMAVSHMAQARGQSLLEITNKIINSFTGALFGVYVLGMFTRRATGTGVLVGGIVGVGVTMGVAFQSELSELVNSVFRTELSTKVVISSMWPSTFGLVTTCVLGYLVSLLTGTSAGGHSREWMWTGAAGAPDSECR